MSIVIETQPAERALVHSGQTQYTFYGDGRVTASGVRAVNRLSLTSMAEGDQAKLIWNGNELILTARNAPSGPYEVPTGFVTVGNTAYLTQLLPYLQEFYLLRKDFTVQIETADFLGFRLTARRPGPQYNLTEHTVLLKSTASNLTPGRAAGLRPRYSVHVALRVQLPGTPGTDLDADFETVFESPLETGTDGRATFDVAPLLEGYLTESYPDVTPATATAGQRCYYIEYAEAYGDPIQVGRVKRSELRHLYQGGATLARQAGLGYALDSVVRQPGRLDYALRLGPLRRYIAPDSIQFLSFLNVGAALTGVRLQVDLAWLNGSASTRTDLVPTLAYPASALLTYGVGPDQLSLATLAPALTLTQYTVRLINQSGQPLTEPYVFVLDYAPRPYARQFAYVNSLGAVDVLTTWGKGSAEYNLFFEQADRPLMLPYAADEGQFEVYQAAYQEHLTVATGFRPERELQQWKDFYRSRAKWYLKRPLSRLAPDARIPMGLVSKSIQEGKDGQNLFAHSFAVTPLRKEQYYSPEDDALEEPAPPRQFAPAGSVTINQVTLVQSRDPSVPEAARSLTPDHLLTIDQLAARGDFNQKGFLKQETTDLLYRAKEDLIPVEQIQDLTQTVYTRSEADEQRLDLQRTIFSQVRLRVRAIPTPQS
ncbi:hypothetical protein [Fibrivirga algicola]|uniref:DUF3857 domain-containing protein n=1 Tax=Fibrivirga algicola TaxID=2950420 RepID=A0ABX0QSC3_9BACT|nr:hypothetical protein [Fibrivirga algicola]NID13787.1 hypothetical protein [Fibrivirga algicola]